MSFRTLHHRDWFSAREILPLSGAGTVGAVLTDTLLGLAGVSAEQSHLFAGAVLLMIAHVAFRLVVR